MMRRRSMARRSGPGLVGTVARTAVIAGTATAVSNKVSHGTAQKQQAQAQAQADAVAQQSAVADLQQQVENLQAQEAQAAIPAAPAAQSDLITKLTQLGELHAAGILTDEEFSAAKAKALS